MVRALFARSVPFTLVIGTCALVPAVAAAQISTEGTRVPVTRNQVVSANPFLLLAEYVNVEFERKASETGTFGVSASRFGFGDANYRNLQAFYRYYPQGAALTGFYLGGRGGVHRIAVDDDSGDAFGLGVEIGYSWLFGKERNFAVSMGVAATRLLGSDLEGASPVIPTFRLVNVGWSF
jgi:hypothetical protein